MLLSSSDTRETLMHLFLFTKFRPERTGFNMYAEYTQPQLTCLALLPWLNLKLRFTRVYDLKISALGPILMNNRGR